MLILLLFIPTTSRVEEDSIKKFKLEVHRYSGLNPDTFGRFMNHIEIFENLVEDAPDTATGHLYDAVEEASKLSLYSPTGELEQLNDVIMGLAVLGERIALKNAVKKKIAFKTQYLKDRYY